MHGGGRERFDIALDGEVTVVTVVAPLTRRMWAVIFVADP
jgi:hypothetical protein